VPQLYHVRLQIYESFAAYERLLHRLTCQLMYILKWSTCIRLFIAHCLELCVLLLLCVMLSVLHLSVLSVLCVLHFTVSTVCALLHPFASLRSLLLQIAAAVGCQLPVANGTAGRAQCNPLIETALSAAAVVMTVLLCAGTMRRLRHMSGCCQLMATGTAGVATST
jgi:hypothetical protein